MKALLINVCILAFSISLLAQKETKSSKNDLIADIDWSMHPRYAPVEFTNETNIVAGYNRRQHKYLESYVNPNGYGITFKAILKNKNNNEQISYKWIIEGMNKEDQSKNSYRDSITTGKKCLFAGSASVNDVSSDCELIRLLPCTGTYKITLTAKVFNSKEQSVFVKTIRLTDYLIVAMGDSFSAGEGNPDVNGISDDENWCDNLTIGVVANAASNSEFEMKKDAVWLEPGGHRSFKSPSSKVAKMIEDSDPHSSVTFLNFACSGGKISYGLLKPQHPEFQTVGQIDEAKRIMGNRRIDALIMSVGINDLSGDCVDCGGASKILITAADPIAADIFVPVLSMNAIKDSLDIEKLKQIQSVSQSSFTNLKTLPSQYYNLNNIIRTKLNPKNIFIYEMTTNIFRNKYDLVEKPSFQFSHVSLAEAVIIDRIGYELNEQIYAAAISNNWNYIGGIVDAFKGHGYNENPDMCWFRAASTSCKIQGDLDGTLHPTDKGHQKVAELAYPLIKAKLQIPMRTGISLEVKKGN